MAVSGNGVKIVFENIGGGLIAKNGKLDRI